MNARWEAHRRFHETGEPIPKAKIQQPTATGTRSERRAERQAAMQRRRAEKARLATERASKPAKAPKTDCTQRGEELGTLICSCRNKPRIYQCGGWSVGKCVLQPMDVARDGPMVQRDGSKTVERYLPESEDLPYSEASLGDLIRIPACSTCPRRIAPPEPTPVEPTPQPQNTPAAEVPASPFPLAPVETIDFRDATCKLCKLAEQCAVKDYGTTLALIQCPAGFWGAVRPRPAGQSAATAPDSSPAPSQNESTTQTSNARLISGQPAIEPGQQQHEQAEPGNG